MSHSNSIRDRTLIGIIGDEDSVTGFLLAGIGHVDNEHKKNFLVVNTETETSVIETFFDELTGFRTDIGIILINQHIADRIRPKIEAYAQALPSLLEIPSKEHPYDPEKDSVLKRVRRLMGDES
ncbi:V-type ATPase, F subunit [Pneumocystis jirovecii RU7]|uniref:V-type proton ATPase subunit F n=1 Tax=Pneumocystis jirovecii (strain RU7) TaxID=1408657 RepID=A0A0W4ZNN8_PNEJ7|nr:V-type ATPase, F subunit [Pneumocystis jirovecii RU7]KTW29986.1 V-type ATPase, F subunit [Pneumocystis jirovecii RU7]